MSGRIATSTVTDGLVLYLDAANPSSYPGSGTVWNDLTANRNNGVLTNDPTFNSANGGSIVFDGVNDYATIPYRSLFNLTTSTTINIWRKANNNGWLLSFDRTGILGYQISLNNIAYYGISPGPADLDYTFTAEYRQTNQWGMVTLVVDRENGLYNIYRDGVFIHSKAITQPALARTFPLVIGARVVPDFFYNGNISQLSYYNRALSAAEILQNYNALKSRFGI